MELAIIGVTKLEDIDSALLLRDINNADNGRDAEDAEYTDIKLFVAAVNVVDAEADDTWLVNTIAGLTVVEILS